MKTKDKVLLGVFFLGMTVMVFSGSALEDYHNEVVEARIGADQVEAGEASIDVQPGSPSADKLNTILGVFATGACICLSGIVLSLTGNTDDTGR